MGKLSRIMIIVGILLLSGNAPVQGAVDLKPVAFNIQSQPVGDALNQWAKQTGYMVMVPTDGSAKSISSTRVLGSYAPEAALRIMLEKTGLTYHFVDAKTVAVESDAAGPGGGASHDETDKPTAEVLVTGTHIRGVVTASPITQISREDIDRSGVSTVDQLMLTLPQNFGLVSGSSFIPNGGRGEVATNQARGSSVDIHGIGPGATLVLLNGHRIAPAGSDGSTVDVSMIPLSAIDHVDIVTDGASALYGADAVAGVVNFVLRRDFDGALTSARYGGATGGGPREYSIGQTLGHSWNTGNLFLSLEDYSDGRLLATQRDYIPDQHGEFDIQPSQERQSAFFSVSQYLTPHSTLSLDALFSHRRFAQTYTEFGTSLEDLGASQAQNYALTYKINLPRQWQLNLTGLYAENIEYVNTPTFDLRYDAQSRLGSGEIRADGPLFKIYGGDVKAAVGVSERRETFRTAGEFSGRNVFSAYAETVLPLVGVENDIRGARRLELSLTGRLDHYTGLGSASEPKFGLLWEPAQGVSLRGTFARSFRVPPLADLSPTQSYLALAIPNPASPSGQTVSLLPNYLGNPELRPETSRSWTAGLDLNPASAPDLKVSLSYFSVDYTNRIVRPIPNIDIFNVFTKSALYSPLVAPLDLAQAQAIFGRYSVETFDPGQNYTPADVQALIEFNLQNVASSRQQGLDLSIGYGWALGTGRVSANASATYLLRSDFRLAASIPSVTDMGRVGYPARLKAKSSLDWSDREWGATLSAYYTGSYLNDQTNPFQGISAWLTADLQIRYAVPPEVDSWLSGFTVAVNVQNLADRRPPYADLSATGINLGFDTTNATALGRVVSVAITRKW